MSALAGDRLINTRNLKLTVLLFVSWRRQPNAEREWKMPLPEHGAAEGVQHTAHACKHPANTDPHKLLHLPWAFWHPQAEWCCLFPWSSTLQFLHGDHQLQQAWWGPCRGHSWVQDVCAAEIPWGLWQGGHHFSSQWHSSLLQYPCNHLMALGEEVSNRVHWGRAEWNWLC